MIKLTENQKEFILNEFFRYDDCAGWRGIATKLLEDGVCIVGGESKIWKGSRGKLIGDYIEVVVEPSYHECSKYTFKMEEFLKSKLYSDTANRAISNTAKDIKLYSGKVESLTKKNKEICELSTLFN